MAVAFGSAATTTQSNSVQSQALNLPSDIAVGDLLIAFVAVNGSGDTITMANWTALFNTVNSGLFVSFRAFYRVATGTDGATEATTGFRAVSAVVVRLSGADTTTPVPQSATAALALGSTATCPAVTTTDDNCLLIRAGIFNNTGTVTGPSGYTVRGNANAGGSNTQTVVATSDTLLTPAGGSGTATFTTTTFAEWTALTLAVKPAPVIIPDPEEPITEDIEAEIVGKEITTDIVDKAIQGQTLTTRAIVGTVD